MRSRTEICGNKGQATVEAACMLPVALLLLTLLLQPICVLYTRSVMSHTAAETARLAAFSLSDADELVSFAKRRLKAVPEFSIFHSGGSDSWDIEITGAGSGTNVTVTIGGTLSLLPVFAPVLSVWADAEEGELRLEVEVSENLQAEWVNGSYDSWVQVWG